MSSMKQVQDLHNQLNAARRQITRLQSDLHRSETATPSNVSPVQPRRARGLHPQARLARTVQQNIGNYGSSLIRVPGHSAIERRSGLADLYLPSARTTQVLVERYFEHIDNWCPLLHRAFFQSAVDELYQLNDSSSVSTAWMGLFYMVLVCGTLAQPNDDATVSTDEHTRFLQLASDYSVATRHEKSADSVALAVLLAVYHLETGANDDCATQLASCVRRAQAMGLHVDTYDNDDMKSQIAKRLWPCICLLDRYACPGCEVALTNTGTES